MDDMHFSFKIENPPAWLPIGRTAENDWRTIEIDCSYWFNMDATGNVVLMYRPSCNMSPYPLLTERDGDNIIWRPKSGELVEGVGRMQAFFEVGTDVIGSSEMISCEVDSSLLGVEPGTDPGQTDLPWALDIIEQIAVLSGHYPKIIDGDLYIWDSTLNDWVEFETGGGGAVESVNGKTGVVVLDASDVGALPDDTQIPSKTSDLTNDSGFVTAQQAAASAPVQSVNGQTGAVTVKTPYYLTVTTENGTTYVDKTPAEIDALSVAGYDVHMRLPMTLGQLTSVADMRFFAALGVALFYGVAWYGSSPLIAIARVTDQKLVSYELTETARMTDIPTSVSELTNDSGYQTAQDVQTAIAAKYTKPSGGIPKTDLASDVQTSLGKADSALQQHQSLSAYRKASEQDAIDATKLNTTGNAYRTASIPMGHLDATSTATVMTATVDGITELRDGVCMWLRNGVVTSASGFTIDVNNLGAKPCYSSLAAESRSTTIFNVNYALLMIYNSTRVDGGCWDIVYGVDTNTTYTPPKLGFGYGTCTTAAATAAKTASISSYSLVAGGIVSIHFDNDVPSGATLNISSKGAKAIYYRGAAITDGVIKAGDTATFVYSTYYHLLSVDSSADGYAPVTAESIGVKTSNTGTQNSSALNSYISANSDAKTIYFNSGTYQFSDTINIATPTNFSGVGRGTKLLYTGTSTFLYSTVYFAPSFYNLEIQGSNSGIGLKIGNKQSGLASCRGVLLNVHMGFFDVAIEVSYGWGWSFISLGAQNINDWLFHVTGVWNTSNIIGGEYEYQSGGGVFWDANSGGNAVNFIGIIWEGLTSHVFKVDDNAANISVNIEGAYFENSKEYNDQVSTAHLIYSNNDKAVFNFVGHNNIGYYQVIQSAGLVTNPPPSALLALGGFRQSVALPNVRFCAVQSPDYQISHGMLIDLEGKTYYTAPDQFEGSTSTFLVDELGINFFAYNASWTTYKNQFDATTPVRQMTFRLPEGAFDLRNITVGFEFLVPSGFDWSTVVGGLINLNGVTGGDTNTTPLDRYLKMLGTDVTTRYNRYQYFRYFRDATVDAAPVTIGGKNYYELVMSINNAEVIITKVIIDDGKQIFATNKLIDAITSGEKQVFETIDQSGSINVSPNGRITNLVLHGKTLTATGKNLCSLGSASWTGVKDFAIEPIPAGDYYFSGHFEGGNPDETYAVMFYDANNNRLITKSTPNNADRIGFPVSFSAPCTKITFYAAAGWGGAQGFTATWSDLQIESGSTPTSYEPYGATGDFGIKPIVRLGNKTLSAVGVSQLFDGDSFDFVNCAYYKASDNTTTPAAINGSVNKVVGDVAVSAGGDVFVGYVTDQ